MTLEGLREKGWIIFEAISGSHAYGTNVPGSDTDIRGVFIQPTDEMLGLTNYIPQVSDEKNDITFYEIGRFLELAAKGNPNIMELLNMPDEQIVHKCYLWDEIFTPEVCQKFITTKLKHTFTGFAYAQIKKARGMNKKIAWEQDRITRKDPLDFAYVVLNDNTQMYKHSEEKQRKLFMEMSHKDGNFAFIGSQDPEYDEVFGRIKKGITPFKHWIERTRRYKVENISIVKLNNGQGVYQMFEIEGSKPLMGDDSNSLRTSEIPKEATPFGVLVFDQNAYSTHCKDYREYQEWLEKRNPERFENNQKHGKGYDSKNLMHTFRLLYMARDIAEGKGIVVRRPEFEELLDIRRGNREYDDLLESAETNVEVIKELFDKTDLPREVSIKWLNKLLTQIRLDNIRKNTIFTTGNEEVIIDK